MTEDIVTYLRADATLTGYIGAGTSCRLYPNSAPKDPTVPYIVFRIQSDQGRTKGNQVRERLYGFSIFSETQLQAETIQRRLLVLLDKDESIVMPSDNYYIKSVWAGGGNSFKEDGTNLHHLSALFTFLFIEK